MEVRPDIGATVAAGLADGDSALNCRFACHEAYRRPD
jgi:hypothetical protein